VYSSTGTQWDLETSGYYYRHRMYHSLLGRFVSRDPVGYEDGMSCYAYVVASPTDHVDPTGLKCRGPSEHATYVSRNNCRTTWYTRRYWWSSCDGGWEKERIEEHWPGRRPAYQYICLRPCKEMNCDDDEVCTKVVVTIRRGGSITRRPACICLERREQGGQPTPIPRLPGILL
jgi:RHS repeat-associated protein